MRQEPLEALSLLAADEAVPVDQAVDVPGRLAKGELGRAELGAVAAEMPGVAAAGELLLRPDAAATPAEVTSLLPALAHRRGQPGR
jgi:hypothetical protein